MDLREEGVALPGNRKKATAGGKRATGNASGLDDSAGTRAAPEPPTQPAAAYVDGQAVKELHVVFPEAGYGWMKSNAVTAEFKRCDFMLDPPSGFHTASPGPAFNLSQGWDSRIGDQKVMAADFSTATGLKLSLVGPSGPGYLFIPREHIQVTWVPQ